MLVEILPMPKAISCFPTGYRKRQTGLITLGKKILSTDEEKKDANILKNSQKGGICL